MNYAELLEPLSRSATILQEVGHGFEAALMDRYVRLLEMLLRVRDRHEEGFDPFKPFEIVGPHRQRLKQAHLARTSTAAREARTVAVQLDVTGEEPTHGGRVQAWKNYEQVAGYLRDKLASELDAAPSTPRPSA